MSFSRPIQRSNGTTLIDQIWPDGTFNGMSITILFFIFPLFLWFSEYTVLWQFEKLNYASQRDK
jgi:hypothetical protein